MSQFPLSAQGLETHLIELYNMPDEIVAAAAAGIRADFRAYLIGNFDLSSAAIRYLGSLDTDWVQYCGHQCALCFLHRLPIRLEYPSPPDPGYVKWVATTNDLSLNTSYYGQLLVTGSFNFEIYWMDE